MEIRIPPLGEGADSGTVVSVLVKVGDTVQLEQTILELENEKAVAPIPSTAAGKITQLHVKEGDKVSVGQVIATLESEGAPSSPSKTPTIETASTPQASIPIAASGVPPAAAPSVRKIARELGIDLRRVQGSERGGRVIMADLRRYIAFLQQAALAPSGTAAASPPPTSMDFSKWGPVKKKARSSLRKTIGDKMHESWTAIPHVTQFDDADITSLMALRKKHVAAYEKKGVKLTLTGFALKVVVAALKKFPTFNSSLDEATGEIINKHYYHIGVAVDTEGGLIVPVIRDVDKKSLFDLSKELGEVAEKTRQRKIAVEDLKGGTFTISNLGGIGGTYFSPIINRPEAAILAIGRGGYKPVVTKDKKMEPRLLMPLGVSYDHRLIDGADGARFIRAVAEGFENFKDDI
jgi:pyruvate dehydrogenase E2 component (dihydrolipoamide acetyltransferase)